MATLVQFDFPFEGPFGKDLVAACIDLARSIQKEQGLLWKNAQWAYLHYILGTVAVPTVKNCGSLRSWCACQSVSQSEGPTLTRCWARLTEPSPAVAVSVRRFYHQDDKTTQCEQANHQLGSQYSCCSEPEPCNRPTPLDREVLKFVRGMINGRGRVLNNRMTMADSPRKVKQFPCDCVHRRSRS